ncbi:tRNA 2-selenouridine(34) synthase MnmH [Parashewanella hymeniacidonis]|uniref:tRNA 2-selenouridine(34) synthase MnmH n=1 Tax=Parashewanella hymeniacidonis TaxID=2807618 RepID=UPI001EF51814|nr:tRNA 2-selenouridine(34) synthase MnmH [Parashewanella hymeniacidonis]
MSATIIAKTEFQRIFTEDRPLLDVRAPIEFNKGAFPHAINQPLMTDEERIQVGTCYKQQGQQAAIELGHQLVANEIKHQRIEAWRQFQTTHPNGYFYCFRGGLRSQISQTWMQQAGFEIPYIEGGYKAMRQYLMEIIEQASKRPMLIVCGKTGSGKTEYIKTRNDAIDLEGIANHRGSSFGVNITPQPTQINFENRLAVNLLKHRVYGHGIQVLEDESFLIGRSAIPKCFYQAMQAAPTLYIEASLDERIERILQDYVISMTAQFIKAKGDKNGFEAFSKYILTSVDKIKKRLGGKLHQQIQNLMQEALKEQQSRNSVALHCAWIQLLLEKYYDPMYEYQMKKMR